MSEHLTKETLERFAKQRETTQDVAAMIEHTSVCQTCRDRLWAKTRMPASIDAMRRNYSRIARMEDAHLDLQTLHNYLAGELEEIERELAEYHLAECQECAASLQTIKTGKASTITDGVKDGKLKERASHRWEFSPAGLSLLAAASLLFALLLMSLFLSGGRRSHLDEQQAGTVQHQLTPAPNPSTEDKSAETNQQLSSTNQPGSKDSAGQKIPLEHGLPPRVVTHQKSHLAKLRSKGSSLVAGSGESLRENFTPSSSRLHSEEDVKQLVAAAIKSGALTYPEDLASLKRRTNVTLKGPNDEAQFDLESPIGIFLLEDRPTFRWQAVPGATYRVLVGDRNNRLVTESPSLSQPKWTPSQPLPRGQILRWQVFANLNGEQLVAPAAPHGDALFSILTAEEARRIQQALNRPEVTHLEKGVLYTHKGILDRAEREFKLFLGENPNSVVAEKLLHDVQAKIRENSGR